MKTSDTGFSPARLARLDEYLSRYVSERERVGLHLRITRHGAVAHDLRLGLRELETGLPIEHDTLYRLFSMSKPITCVAAMQLYERGLIGLNDPVAKYIPSFENLRVYRGGIAANPVTHPAAETMTVKHLLTHTSGLSQPSRHLHVTDEIMRTQEQRLGAMPYPYPDLAAACDSWATMPLQFEPGTGWEYGVSTDVLGRVIEVATGQSLDEYLQESLIGPLGMTDTAFVATDLSRLSALYLQGDTGIERFDARGSAAHARQKVLSGGGALVSSMDDYVRFTQMLLNGGVLDGERVLSPRTVKYMCTNQLPGGVDLDSFGPPLFHHSPFVGIGFGMGFSVTIDPVAHGIASSPGEITWNGLGSTYFWVDPTEDMSVILMTQLVPADGMYPLRERLKPFVYSALVG